jgi:hypothetical protein
LTERFTSSLKIGKAKTGDFGQNDLSTEETFFAMKTSKFTEKQIAFALRQAGTEAKVRRSVARWGFRKALFTAGKRNMVC